MFFRLSWRGLCVLYGNHSPSLVVFAPVDMVLGLRGLLLKHLHEVFYLTSQSGNSIMAFHIFFAFATEKFGRENRRNGWQIDASSFGPDA